MVQIKGHKKYEKRRGEPWPRKYVPPRTEGKCPYCKKHVKSIEEHIKKCHKFEKPKPIKGIRHGHE